MLGANAVVCFNDISFSLATVCLPTQILNNRGWSVVELLLSLKLYFDSVFFLPSPSTSTSSSVPSHCLRSSYKLPMFQILSKHPSSFFSHFPVLLLGPSEVGWMRDTPGPLKNAGGAGKGPHVFFSNTRRSGKAGEKRSPFYRDRTANHG